MQSWKMASIKECDLFPMLYFHILDDLHEPVPTFVLSVFATHMAAHTATNQTTSSTILSCFDPDVLPPPLPLSDNARGFLATLEHSSEEELTLHLQDRMQFSKDAMARLVCVFDRLHSCIDNMCKQVQDAGKCRDKHIIAIHSQKISHSCKAHRVLHSRQ